MILVQTEDFDVATEYQKLVQANITGAVVTFSGLVRDFGGGAEKSNFLLQHYPGMTEKVLQKIEDEAHQKWDLIQSTIIHRVGKLSPSEQIVFVGVSSAHRKDAFAACEFMIDILKTEAPFWKKEGDAWVDAKTDDQARAERWLK